MERLGFASTGGIISDLSIVPKRQRGLASFRITHPINLQVSEAALAISLSITNKRFPSLLIQVKRASRREVLAT